MYHTYIGFLRNTWNNEEVTKNMYRYINIMLAIEKLENESDEKTEQRLRESLVGAGFFVSYDTGKPNYNV